MSVMAVGQVLLVLGAAGAAVVGSLYLFGRYRPLAAQRAAVADTTAAQRSHARAVIAAKRSGGHGRQVDPVVAGVAVDMAVRTREAANSFTMVLLCALAAFSATAWALVAFAVSAAANLAVGVVMLVRRGRAKRFLADHREIAVPARSTWWMR